MSFKMRQNILLKRNQVECSQLKKKGKSAIFIVLLINFIFTFAYMRINSQILKAGVIYFTNLFLYIFLFHDFMKMFLLI